jgi:hypothetical protein
MRLREFTCGVWILVLLLSSCSSLPGEAEAKNKLGEMEATFGELAVAINPAEPLELAWVWREDDVRSCASVGHSAELASAITVFTPYQTDTEVLAGIESALGTLGGEITSQRQGLEALFLTVRLPGSGDKQYGASVVVYPSGKTELIVDAGCFQPDRE